MVMMMKMVRDPQVRRSCPFVDDRVDDDQEGGGVKNDKSAGSLDYLKYLPYIL